MVTSIFNILRIVLSFFPPWLLSLIAILVLFLSALFIWRLIKWVILLLVLLSYFSRLLDFLKNFLPIPSDEVPKDSILREFIGGSGFGE